MKSFLTILLIALLFGYLGGISSRFFQPGLIRTEHIQAELSADVSNSHDAHAETNDIISQISQLQQKIDKLEIRLNEIRQNQLNVLATAEHTTKRSTSNIRQSSQPSAPSRANLIDAGIDPNVADDILRRINEQYYRRLELQNLIQRRISPDTQQYREELRELNRNIISLRSELGDDRYDKYLFVSGQNNRMKVTSVINGSPAESSGFQEGDVILFYDNKKILNLSDMREATLTGEIGQFTTVGILRDGMPLSLTIPRGTLGLQLEAIQLDPASYQ